MGGDGVKDWCMDFHLNIGNKPWMDFDLISQFGLPPPHHWKQTLDAVPSVCMSDFDEVIKSLVAQLEN